MRNQRRELNDVAQALTITPEQLAADPPRLGGWGARLAAGSAMLGALGLAASYALALAAPGGMQRFYFSYVLSFAYFVSITLGALFFVMLQHLTRASWSVVLRRIAESITGAFPLLAVLSLPLVLPLLFGDSRLYAWLAPQAAADPLLAHKHAFLNLPFFLIRLALYFAVWTGAARLFCGLSARQDAQGGAGLTLRMWRSSAPAMLLFAVTTTLFAIDFLMALDAHWFSTIFGVYFFGGCVVGLLATLALSAMLLQRAGLLRGVITTEHYHDLGKLLFAFTFFWGYIAFSQYLLYWYANLPEETGWYLRRQSGEWLYVIVALLFVHFLVPFAVLLSRAVKRRKRLLAVMCVWLLAAHWLDLYFIVMPELAARQAPGKLVLDPLLLSCFIAVGGLWLAVVVWQAGRRAIVPLRDPQLADSLRFENV
jgi:hypothetical protein